jgi:hypothetical protein
LGAEVKPHGLRTLPKGVDVEYLKEVKVLLQIPLENWDDRFIELGKIVDLTRLI